MIQIDLKPALFLAIAFASIVQTYSAGLLAQKVSPAQVNEKIEAVTQWYLSTNPHVQKLRVWLDPEKTDFKQRFGQFNVNAAVVLDPRNASNVGNFDLFTDYKIIEEPIEDGWDRHVTASGKFTFNGDVVWVLNRILQMYKKNCVGDDTSRQHDVNVVRSNLLCRELKKMDRVENFQQAIDMVLTFVGVTTLATNQVITYLEGRLPLYRIDEPNRVYVVEELARLRKSREKSLSFKADFYKDKMDETTSFKMTSPDGIDVPIGTGALGVFRFFYVRKAIFYISKKNIQFSFVIQKYQGTASLILYYGEAMRRFLPNLERGEPRTVENFKNQLEGSLLKMFDWLKSEEFPEAQP